MQRIFIFLITAIIGLQIQAQKISGIVKDDQGKVLNGASIALRIVKDSSTVKLGATNVSGNYIFEGIRPGKYFISTTFIGYVSRSISLPEIMAGQNLSAPDIVLTKSSGNLKEVVVTSRKPVIEVKADRTILNVEGSVNAVGQDALELLRKSPGVMVDKDENISLSGKNGVQVFVDGRPTPLSGADLSAYLKTLQSSSIEAIEIITNPSAKYEAAGNAGIINIRLKKNKSFGTNGSVNGGFSQGIFPKYIGGIALNNRSKKVNVFGNYNYNNSRNESFISFYRKLFDTLFDQRSTMTMQNSSHNFKAGLDYFINPKTTIGIMVNGNFADNTFDNISRTPISYIPTGQFVKLLVADNSSKSKRNNANLNLNYRYADSSGHELNMDADYGTYKIDNDQLQPNFYYNANGFIIDNRIYNMIAPTDIDIYSFKTDYEQNFKKGRLGLGGKIGYVSSNNNFERYNVVSSFKSLDTLRSNNFDYKENINALYANYNRNFKGFMIQLGVRMENTNVTGTSNGFKKNGSGYNEYDSSFTRNYTNFFPSAAITFNKNPTSQLGLQYSRRIDRPAYQDLNPFEFKLDEYTFQKGNTQLTPQYTNSFGITHTYKYKLTSTLSYSHVKDVFTQLIDTAEISKSFITKKNLATQDITSLNISYPFQYKSYSLFVNLNGYYSHYKANLGTGRNIDLEVFAFNLYQQHTVKFAKVWTAELSGFYSSPSIWQGTFKSKEIYGIDAGLLRTVLKGKGTIKAAVSDIFQTMRWGGTSDFASQYIKAGGGWESRLLKLNFTYRFGSNEIKAARQRKSAVEDENKRVGSQGGGISN